MKRSFILGDEWIYYKLYCGKRTADEILINVIKPLSEKLIQNKIIDKWFFIRYKDPDFHLRIRFHLNVKENLTQVIYQFNQEIQPYIHSELVWRLQTDTYFREIERYGITTIENAENFFYIDSLSCLKALELIEDEDLIFIYVLRSIDNLLNIFDFSNEEKIAFSRENLSYFKDEFNSNKQFSKQLYIKYSFLKEQIIFFMKDNLDEEYIILENLLKEKTEQLILWKNEIFKKTDRNILITHYLSSYIHMMVNRFFRDKQRIYELVSYDSLHRYYNYKKAMIKND